LTPTGWRAREAPSATRIVRHGVRSTHAVERDDRSASPAPAVEPGPITVIVPRIPSSLSPSKWQHERDVPPAPTSLAERPGALCDAPCKLPMARYRFQSCPTRRRHVLLNPRGWQNSWTIASAVDLAIV
jgi:hypothetical protein